MLMALAETVDPDVGDLFDSGGAPLTDHYAETQLLGFLLNKPQAVTETIEIIRPCDLHDPFHRRVYELVIKAFETDVPITAEALIAGLGGDKAAGATIASLISGADLAADVSEIADHLSTVAERRAVGTVEDIDFTRGAPFVSRFGSLRWEEIGTAIGEVGYTWFIEDIMPMGEISLVFGDSGSGKSFNMFDMAMAGARGTMWNGHNVERGLVVYVAAEAGAGFSKRKIAYALQHKLEPTDPLPFVLITKRPDFFHDDTDAVALIEEINGIARGYNVPLVCIVIDTLSALAPGMNENHSADVSMVRKRLVMMQEQFKASIILVHHKPKGGSTPRGHGSLTADFETTIEFETVVDKKTDAGKLIHRAIVRKQREGKAGAFWEFTLPIVEVGKNKWGNPETSCAVEPYVVGTPKAGMIGFHATRNELLFMRALYDALVDHSVPPPVGLPNAIKKVVDIAHVRALVRERTIAAHEDTDAADNRFRVAFKRAGDKLRDGGVIGVQGLLIWPTGKAVQGFSGPTMGDV